MQRWIWPALVAAAAFGCFAPALGADFVNWDDDVNFLNNPHYRTLDLRWMFTDTTITYAPLVWMSHWVDYSISGMDPWAYHLNNLLIHAANAVLCYYLMLSLVGSPRAAAVAALFFAIHPLRVESVAWVTERRDVLSGFFWFLAMLAYLKFCRANARRWYAASVAAFACGILSKGLLMTTPAVLLLLNVYPLRRPLKRALVESIPFFLLAAAAAYYTVAGGLVTGAVYSAETYTTIDRVLQPGWRWTLYLWKMIAPMDLSPLYLHETAGHPKFYAGWAIVLAATAAAFTWRRRAPWLLAAWLCCGIMLSPILGLMQAGPHMIADRYTYLALLPWAALLGAGLARAKPAWFAVAGVGLAALGALTVLQTRVWHDSVSLWTKAIEVDERNYIAWLNRGIARAQRNDPAAEGDFRRAADINPGFPPTFLNIGIWRFKAGAYEEAEGALAKTLALDPNHAHAYRARANVRLFRGNIDGALSDFGEAIAREPNRADTYRARAEVRRFVDDRAGARADLDAAIRLDPGDGQAYRMRAELRLEAGEFQAALDDLNAAVARMPDDFDARVLRGAAHGRLGRAAEANADFDAAVRLDPDPATPYVVRGRVLMMRGDLDGAIRELEEALRRTTEGTAMHARAVELIDVCRRDR